MVPTAEQVRVAAYHRWERRGGDHGRDRDDWIAAEHDLNFALNYRVIARFRLDGVGPQAIGGPSARRCRFCEQAAPRAPFGDPPLALPAALGNATLRTFEECDDCHAQFARSIEGDLERFARPFLGDATPAPFSPIAAYKGLVRAALAVVPREELPYFDDAIEWVSNTDHGLDSGLLRGLDCHVSLMPAPFPFSWAALARRVGDEPVPYLLFFAGTGSAAFQVHVPLCVRDEDLEGGPAAVPRPAPPVGLGHGLPPDRVVTIPLSSASPNRWAAEAATH